jgi:hypothetical protein
MKYIQTTLKTYDDFVLENNTDVLSKKLKLHVSKMPKYLKIDEIFDSNFKLVENVDFYITEYNHFKYKEEKNYIYSFTIKDIDYRLDFIVLRENNNNLKNAELYDKNFISISFSLKNRKSEDYDIPTELNNQYEVMNYIIYLINNFKDKINEDYIFMFGDPKDNRKFNIYEFIVKQCFPNYKIIKDYSSGFTNTNIGFYLI